MSGKRAIFIGMVMAVIGLGGSVRLHPVMADSLSMPTVEAPRLIEGIGGIISLNYDKSATVYEWTFSLYDAGFVHDYYQIHSDPNGSVVPDQIYWNGSALTMPNPPDWSMFPAGAYTAHLHLVYLVNGRPVLRDVEQPVKVQPKVTLHPVLFIHGVTSYPEMWTDPANNSDYFSLLEMAGYPSDLLASYHYSGTGVGINGYNNQGDIVEMAMGMESAVNKLSQISKEYGGDGIVDIVCHSMGGLISRQYLLTHPTNHHIGKIISIATPYQGSWWMSADDVLGNPVTGGDNGTIQLALNSQIFDVLHKFGFEPDPNNKSEEEMTPGSNFLQSISAVRSDPMVQYYTLFGDIDVTVTQKLFGLTLRSDKTSLGDLAVSSRSASTVSQSQPSISQAFVEPESINISSNVIKNNFGFNTTYSMPNVLNLHYMHIVITEQSDVQQKVLEDLANEK